MLKRLGLPSENATTENPGAAFQKESSTPPTEEAGAVEELADAIPPAVLEDLPENAMPVAPVAASTHGSYKHMTLPSQQY